MYTIPPAKESAETQASREISKDLVVQMAQRLYDHFSRMNLNTDQWLVCLEEFLAEQGKPGGLSRKDIEEKIKNIIRSDKHIPLEWIPEESQKAIYREVAEWLAAEKICEKMIVYENAIQEGLESGRFKKFHQIQEVNVIRDGDNFCAESSQEELIQFIRDNYVIDMQGPQVGAGARVVVRELKPVKFPLPYPKKDELRDGMMLKVPNDFLVLRLTKSSYRDVLGSQMMESEEKAIRSFIRASDLLVFKGTEKNIDDISANIYERVAEAVEGGEGRPAAPDPAVKKTPRRRKKVYSFIPPLMIMRAQVGSSGCMEYMTIQKKVDARGQIIRGDRRMREDLIAIPGFKSKLRKFLDACKRFYAATGCLPDTVGNGNVLYTRKGNIYQVDINNIAPEPHFRLIGLVGLAKELKLKGCYEEEYRQVRREMLSEMEGKEQYDAFRDEQRLNRVIEMLYIHNKDKTLRDFFSAAGLIDDLYLPIFLHNISNLIGLEWDLLQCELEAGKITREDFNARMDQIYDEPLYRFSNSMTGVWKNKRSYVFQDFLDNKKQGHNNWAADYVSRIYGGLTAEEAGI